MFDNSSMNNPDWATSLPEIERMIILQGLLYGIACIQAQPNEQPERGGMIGMCTLARRMGGAKFSYTLWGVEHHIGNKVDLWPAGGGSAPNGDYSDEELEIEETICGEIEKFKAKYALTGLAIDAPPSDVVKFL